MSYYSSPDSSGAHTLTTDADVTRARALAAQLAILFPDPAAPVAVRLHARAGSSPANGSAESLRPAGSRGSATVPGPA